MIYIYILNYNVYIQAESQFRVCVLWRTRPLWSVKASPSETLLTWSAVVKCDGLAFGAFPGCVTRCFTLTSRFLPPRPAKVTIYATRCRHFSVFLSSFPGAQRILGYVRPWRTVVLHPPKTGKRRSIWRSLQTGTDFTRRCDVIGLQMLLWRIQTWTETQQQ